MALLNVFNFIKYSCHLASNDGFTKCLYYLFHIDIRVELLSRCWVTAFTQKPWSKQFFSHVSINMYETQRPLLFCVVLFTVEAGKHHLFCFLFIVFICLEENKIIFHAFFTYIHLRFLQFIDQNWAISPSTKPSVSSDPVVCSIIPSWDCLGPRILGLHLSPAVLETGTEPSALRRKASGKLDVLLSGEA